MYFTLRFGMISKSIFVKSLKYLAKDKQRIRDIEKDNNMEDNRRTGLKMPVSNTTVESKARQRQLEEMRRSQTKVERREHPGYRNSDIKEDNGMRNNNRQISKKALARKRKMKRLWSILGAEVVIFSLLLIGYAIFYANNKMDEMNYNDLNIEDLSINEGLSDLTNEKYTTIALFGIDARDVTTDKGNRSDTIIIACVNNETKEVKLVSVYRDCYLEQENPVGSYDDAYTKITHAYAFGGPTATIATLNKNLDLQITEYVTVNFASLTDVIDDLGGITLHVDEDERQSVNIWIPETADIAGMSYTPLYETGDVTLDGLQAVTYARIRNIGNGDIDRAGRQREVLAAILDKMKKSDLRTLNKILDHVLPEVSTSLSKKEILALMANLMEYELVGDEGFPFIYDYGSIYDEPTDMYLDMDVPANLVNNVVLLHQYLYDAQIESEATGIDNVGSASNNSSEDVEYYSPSVEVQRISDRIQSFTGAYPPEDPEFRGLYMILQ